MVDQNKSKRIEKTQTLLTHLQKILELVAHTPDPAPDTNSRTGMPLFWGGAQIKYYYMIIIFIIFQMSIELIHTGLLKFINEQLKIGRWLGQNGK